MILFPDIFTYSIFLQNIALYCALYSASLHYWGLLELANVILHWLKDECFTFRYYWVLFWSILSNKAVFFSVIHHSWNTTWANKVFEEFVQLSYCRASSAYTNFSLYSMKLLTRSLFLKTNGIWWKWNKLNTLTCLKFKTKMNKWKYESIFTVYYSNFITNKFISILEALYVHNEHCFSFPSIFHLLNNEYKLII